ncbi:MAG: hypothetical protein M1483_07285 [Actinobacteria bacterium]|nr:hypothetical protein [Actinomycetota bacterium]
MVGTACLKVLVKPTYAVVFLLLAAVLSAVYTIMLSGKLTGKITFSNINAVTPDYLVLGTILGVLMALILIENFYSLIMFRSARMGFGIGGGVIGILSGSLCCTTIVPTLLAFFGAGTSALYSTTGKVQGFFASYEPWLITASIVLMLLGLFNIAPYIAGATCNVDSARKVEATCEVDTNYKVETSNSKAANCLDEISLGHASGTKK